MSMLIRSKKAAYLPVLIALLFGLLLSFTANQRVHAAGPQVNVTVTSSDLTKALSPQTAINFTDGTNTSSGASLTVDEKDTYQTIDGFGAAMTDLSAYNITQWTSTDQRNAILTNLFDPTNGIGMNIVRVPIAGSDFNALGSEGKFTGSNTYTYDDNGGNADPDLTNFSIAHDTAYIIPVLQQVKSLNGNFKMLATPWAQDIPSWMLTGDTSGVCGNGSITVNPGYYATFANYITKFIQAYNSYNIPTYAVTPMNEPLCARTVMWSAQGEDNFIKNNLGPTFANQNINTKIFAYDHNWDRSDYPDTILNDSAASPYVSGVAWHAYAGDPSAMTTLHNSYPNVTNWSTESSDLCGGTDMPDYLFDTMLNWGQAGIWWNIATRSDDLPCDPFLQVNPADGTTTYRAPYYQMGQFSKFVHPGASRIYGTSQSNNITAVSFKNTDGSKVVVAHNTSSSASQTLTVNWGGESFNYTLAPGDLDTFTWSGSPTISQLFYDDFEEGNANQWTPVDGSWNVCQVGSNSREYCSGDPNEDISLAGNTSWTDYSVQSYVVPNGTGYNQGIELLARAQDGNHFYQGEIKDGNAWSIWKNNGGSWSQIAYGNFNSSANSYYLLKFVVEGDNLSLWYSPDFSGNTWSILGSGTDSTFSSGKIGVRTWGTTGRFDQVNVLTL